MTDLLELAAKVEGLNGPSRAIDGMIAMALGEYPSWAPIQNERQPELFTDGKPGTRAREWLAPKFTSSVDAAMTLVPEGHTVQLSDWDHETLRQKGSWQAIVLPFGARGAMKDFTFTNRCDHAATPALALVAAALRARAHGGGEG